MNRGFTFSPDYPKCAKICCFFSLVHSLNIKILLCSERGKYIYICIWDCYSRYTNLRSRVTRHYLEQTIPPSTQLFVRDYKFRESNTTGCNSSWNTEPAKTKIAKERLNRKPRGVWPLGGSKQRQFDLSFVTLVTKDLILLGMENFDEVSMDRVKKVCNAV